MKHDDVFDVVIVGGGPSAMGLLLGLLERVPTAVENPPFTIAVVERGKAGDASSIRSPCRWFESSHSSSYSTLYASTPQTQLNGRIVDVPTGRSFGGGTNINACLLFQPAVSDFDTWPGVWKGGRKILDASNVLLHRMRDANCLEFVDICDEYKRLCCSMGKVDEQESAGTFSRQGVQTTAVEFPSFVSSVPTATRRVGTSNTEHQYQRVNYFQSLIQPLLDKRPDLLSRRAVTFYEGVQVERIVLEKSCAKGVQCRRSITPKESNDNTDSEIFEIRANRQVILCCGAILSPALLLVSGIGDPADLKQAGIETCYRCNEKFGDSGAPPRTTDANMGVGRNLRDHVLLPRMFLSSRSLQQARKSINSVQGIYNLDIRRSDATVKSESCPVQGEKSHTHRLSMHIGDGTIVSGILPYFVSSQFRKSLHGTKRGPRWRWALSSANLFVSRVLVAVVKSVLTILFKNTPIGYFMLHHTVGFQICLLNPASTGRVSVRRKELATKKSGRTSAADVTPPGLSDFDIVIDLNYLTDERDLEAMEAGFDATEELRKVWFGKENGFIDISPGILFRNVLPLLLGYPGDRKQSTNESLKVESGKREWLRRYAASFVCPYFHWSGTCGMGAEGKSASHNVNRAGSIDISDTQSCAQPRDNFVVTDRLLVRGFKGLRVCDASVFPTCTSGPTALTCASLGYGAAPIVIKDCTGKDE